MQKVHQMVHISKGIKLKSVTEVIKVAQDFSKAHHNVKKKERKPKANHKMRNCDFSSSSPSQAFQLKVPAFSAYYEDVRHI